MRSTARPNPGGTRHGGFSMIELLVVMAIIAVVAAMALPAIGRYIRVYKIRGAQQQVVGQIQFARNKAITKNTNQGMSFVVESATAYWVHIEDDQSLTRSVQPMTLTFASPAPLQSTRYELPQGVRFATTASECSIAGFAPNAHWLRFNRLGASCASSCGSTPVTGAPPANVIWNSATGSALCVYQPDTGLKRSISISPGGRVQTEK